MGHTKRIRLGTKGYPESNYLHSWLGAGAKPDVQEAVQWRYFKNSGTVFANSNSNVMQCMQPVQISLLLAILKWGL